MTDKRTTTRASIRKRLTVLLLATLSAMWCVLVVAAYIDTHRELDALLDAHLMQSAQLLTRQAGHELLELEPLDYKHVASYTQKFAVQVWDREGTLVVAGNGAPLQRLSPVESGFSDVVLNGEQWRVFSDWDIDRVALVQVAELHDTRERLAMRVAINSLWPLLIALPSTGLLVWWLAGTALRPLTRASAEVASRDSRNLDPLEIADAPAEVRPLIERLNELLARIGASLENERRFAADAAHELRNPVAAIRAQAEAALESQHPHEHAPALQRVVDTATNLGRVVDQLLTLAKLDAPSSVAQLRTVDLTAAVKPILAELGPAILAQHGELELDAPDALPVKGDAALLQVVVRNLVENAVQHGATPPQIGVGLGTRDGQAWLRVTNTGPDIDAEDRTRVFSPFYRGATAQGAGSGLGLSIVNRIARLHGGHVIIDRDAERGRTIVEMRWPDSR